MTFHIHTDHNQSHSLTGEHMSGKTMMKGNWKDKKKTIETHTPSVSMLFRWNWRRFFKAMKNKTPKEKSYVNRTSRESLMSLIDLLAVLNWMWARFLPNVRLILSNQQQFAGQDQPSTIWMFFLFILFFFCFNLRKHCKLNRKYLVCTVQSSNWDKEFVTQTHLTFSICPNAHCYLPYFIWLVFVVVVILIVVFLSFCP